MSGRQRRWVFESRAPIEEFRRRLKMILRSRGYPMEGAKVFDFAAKVRGFTAYVALRYHHRGIEATVKVKGGLLGDPDPVQREMFEALRTAQLELAGKAVTDRHRTGPADVRAAADAEDTADAENAAG